VNPLRGNALTMTISLCSVNYALIFLTDNES
jgi:hypothetical protein